VRPRGKVPAARRVICIVPVGPGRTGTALPCVGSAPAGPRPVGPGPYVALAGGADRGGGGTAHPRATPAEARILASDSVLNGGRPRNKRNRPMVVNAAPGISGGFPTEPHSPHSRMMSTVAATRWWVIVPSSQIGNHRDSWQLLPSGRQAQPARGDRGGGSNEHLAAPASTSSRGPRRIRRCTARPRQRRGPHGRRSRQIRRIICGSRFIGPVVDTGLRQHCSLAVAGEFPHPDVLRVHAGGPAVPLNS
jgi:hypothetical protein